MRTHRKCFLGAFALLSFIAVPACAALPPLPGNTNAADNAASQNWQQEFNLGSRTLVDTGESQYFVLKPGFQIELASSSAKLIITVLNETRVINGIKTRVVEEREEKNGELYEIARNFYAMDAKTGDAFYFGEEVDFYKGGQITGHAGAWIAYANEN